MIKRIVLKKLLGRFDYDLNFNDEGVTILTGPNGFGKSTILKCIESLSENGLNISYLLKLDFTNIELYFDNSTIIFNICKDDDSLTINDEKFDISLFKKRNATFLLDDMLHAYLDNMDNDENLHRVYERFLYKNYRPTYIRRRNYDIDFEEFEEMKDSDFLKKLFPLFIRISQMIGKVYFVKEQRLLRERKKIQPDRMEIIEVISDLPDKLRKLFNDVSQKYSGISNTLDSTYPTRLFDTEKGITEKEYKEKISTITEKFKKLSKYDISDIPNIFNVIFKSEHAKALKVYFDDFDAKYKVYEDFIKRLWAAPNLCTKYRVSGGGIVKVSYTAYTML